jgi:hypothetical protein
MATAQWTSIRVGVTGTEGVEVPDGQDLGPAMVTALARCAAAPPAQRFVQITGEVSPGSRLTLPASVLTLLAANRVGLRLVGRPGPAPAPNVVPSG